MVLKFYSSIIAFVEAEGEVCSEECSSSGCWGKGPDQCLECKSFIHKGTCLPDCKSTEKYVIIILCIEVILLIFISLIQQYLSN